MAEIKVRVGSKNAIKVPATFGGQGGTLAGLSDVDVSGGLSNGMNLYIMDQHKNLNQL